MQEEEDEWSVTEESNTAAAGTRTERAGLATRRVNAKFIPGNTCESNQSAVARKSRGPAFKTSPLTTHFYSATAKQLRVVWTWAVDPARCGFESQERWCVWKKKKKKSN